MSPVDQRDRLQEKPFSYGITKADKTLIYYENRQIMILGAKDTKKLKAKLSGKGEHDIQLILAKVTGHFKHGNER